MNLEKRILIASLLSLGILLLFSSLYKSSRPLPAAAPPLAQQKSKPAEPIPSFAPPACAAAQKVSLANMDISICATGGYVKEIVVRPYGDRLLFHNLFYLPQLADKTFTVIPSAHKITMTYKNGTASITKEIILKSKNILVFRVNNNLDKYINNVLISSFAKAKGFYARYQEFLFKNSDVIKRLPWRRLKGKEYAFLEAGGFRSRYYAFIGFNLSRISLAKDKSNVYLFSRLNLKPHQVWSQTVFLGPQNLTLLTPLHLSWIVNYGLFNPIALITLKALNFVHGILGNWGASIILISVIIYLMLFPLSAAGFKSMQKMQSLQPKIEALKLKYKDDAAKLNQATLELYKKEGVNPLGGCLPMILQIPIFFAFYQALIRSVEIKGASFLWIKDLSKPDYFIRLPQSFPLIGNGIHLLPIIMALIMFFQQKLTSGKGKTSEQQKIMTMILPLVFGFIFYNFPAGLVLYWLINNLLGFLYQYRLARQLS